MEQREMELNSKAFSEVNAIINKMEEKEKKRIPIKFQNFIKNNRDIFYIPNIEEMIQKRQLNRQTIVILGIIYETYFKGINES